jgi:hypothetical protein
MEKAAWGVLSGCYAEVERKNGGGGVRSNARWRGSRRGVQLSMACGARGAA